MTEKPTQIAQKMINLYRQAHVIIGGWSAVNAVFLAEADDTVIAEIEKLPCGDMLAEHIENLQSGKTKPDGIEAELLPYGGAMNGGATIPEKLNTSELNELRDALDDFIADDAHVLGIKNLDVIKKFGPEWSVVITNALAGDDDLSQKWKTFLKTDRAYTLWGVANDILSNPISERERARVQADLLEYETYLPMFGDAGAALLAKLRAAVSTMDK